MRRMTTIASVIKHIKSEKKGGSTIVQKAKHLALATMVNHIWYARNCLIFEDISFDVKNIFKSIQGDVYSCLYSMFPVDGVVSHLEIALR